MSFLVVDSSLVLVLVLLGVFFTLNHLVFSTLIPFIEYETTFIPILYTQNLVWHSVCLVFINQKKTILKPALA